jgi:hypothetical protein
MIPELTMQRLPSRDSKVRKYKIGDLRKAVLGVLAESYYELATMFKLLDEVEKNSAEGSVLLEAIAFRWTRECMKEVLKNEVGSLSKSWWSKTEERWRTLTRISLQRYYRTEVWGLEEGNLDEDIAINIKKNILVICYWVSCQTKSIHIAARRQALEIPPKRVPPAFLDDRITAAMQTILQRGHNFKDPGVLNWFFEV